MRPSCLALETRGRSRLVAQRDSPALVTNPLESAVPLNDDGSRGAMCVWAPLQADVVLMDDPLSALDSKVGRRVANEAIQVS